MDKIAESGSERERTGNYLGLNFVRAPKKNHDAMAQIGKPFAEWFKNQAVRTEIYYLGSSTKSEQNNEEPLPEGIESISKTLSTKNDEEIWAMLQFYKDQNHAEEVTANMMQDTSMGQLMKKFDDLITQGSSLIMGGFSRHHLNLQ